jgi:VanZ family protein
MTNAIISIISGFVFIAQLFLPGSESQISDFCACLTTFDWMLDVA